MAGVSNPNNSGVRPLPWWRRRGPSFAVFCVVLLAMVAIAVRTAISVSEALPQVGRDEQGDDPWSDPVGVEKVGSFQIAHVPDCAAGPVVRIALWDESSKPYWEVSGPPTPMTMFVIGVTPKGFTSVVPLRTPRPGASLRLVVIRRVKGAAGVRYTSSDLRPDRVVAMLPLSRFTIAGFQTADVCGKKPKTPKTKGTSKSNTIVTVPGGG